MNRGFRTDEDLPEPNSSLSVAVVSWFPQHGRDFPWRSERDPFLILAVEIMLQRTRASQVEPVFNEFRERFSRPSDVLAAGRGAVDDMFGRLGLLWRADHFWRLQEVLALNGDQPPHSVEALMKLPGVGAYAATAVAVFAHGGTRTVVDANVLRVLGRYYGICFDDGSRRRKRVLEWASEHAPSGPEASREFNWALLDLGALVCTPRKPDCRSCPLVSECRYGQRNIIASSGELDES